MEQFCSNFAVWVQIWPPYTLCKCKQIIEKSFWTGPINLPLVSELLRWWHFSPFGKLGKMEQFCSNFAVWVQIWPPYTLCKWKQIIEKSFWTGPLICHRFRSSQRWWHFSPLSRLGKMEQFCSIFAVSVQIWPPYTYVYESKSLRRVSGQDPLICHRFRSSQRLKHFSPLSRLG